MLPPLIMFFFCLGWPSEHKGLLVTDTACLCLIPVCMLYQDTRDIPYAYITRIDLCSHQRGPIFRPIIVYTRWYSEHTLSQLLIQHSCTDFLFTCSFRTPGMSLMHIRSGLCVHPKGGRPSEGVPLFYYEGCDQPRLKLDLYQLKGNAKILLCR